MIRLQTEVNCGAFSQKALDYGEGLMSFGSCFSEHIGAYLQELGHKVELNPFGVLYNPMSICLALRRLLDHRPYTLDELIEYDGLFHSFDHHGDFSFADPERALQAINEAYERAVESLASARLLFITWGTAYIYHYNRDNRVVGNCHKIPAQSFTRRLYSVQELTAYVEETFAKLFEAYPNIHIITTVSPIRHLRDGASQNQLSKATLLLMNEALRQKYPEQISYFPAYEILLDELRDYRFYTNDLTHPNDLATSIIKERLTDYLLSDKAKELGQIALRMKREYQHKPLHPDHPDYELRREQLFLRIRSFQRQYPEINLSWFEEDEL